MRFERRLSPFEAQAASLLAFALVGCAVVDLPLVAQPEQRSAWWTLGGALVGVAFALLTSRGAGRAREAAWPCMVAVGIGMAWDFQRIPASAILDLCRSDASVGAVLAAHLRWFPATAIAMVLAIALPRLHDPTHRADPPDRLFRLAIVALDVAGMAIVMVIAMPVVKATAAALGLPWIGAAMTFAMLAGMFLFAAAQALARHPRGIRRGRPVIQETPP